jgi:parallel beta-helix repeat protein
VICVFKPTTENVYLPPATDVRIFECHDAEITALDPTKPVIHIPYDAGDGNPNNNSHPSDKDIFINGLTVREGSVGILVKNNSTELKAIRAENNGWALKDEDGEGAGIRVEGNTNVVNGSNAEESNGPGIEVTETGSKNTVRNSKALKNSGDGFLIAGSKNLVKANTAQQNVGEGFKISGDYNILQDNIARNNVEDGFTIIGAKNQLKKNRAECNGVNDEEDGGFDFPGPGNNNVLTENLSCGNTAFEYRFEVDSNISGGGNRACNSRVLEPRGLHIPATTEIPPAAPACFKPFDL